MSTRYHSAVTCGPGATPAAPARLPGSARHQLWHLSSPLLRALLAGAAATGVYTPHLLAPHGGQHARLER